MTNHDEGRLLREIAGLLTDLEIYSDVQPGMNSDLSADFGLDSLARVELHDRLERAFSIRLPEQVLEEAVTPADWLEAIRKARTGTAERAPAERAVQLVSPEAEPAPKGFQTLPAALAWHAGAHPDQITIRILAVPETGLSEDISYGALARAATAVARGLAAEGLGSGERVALMLPTGRHYFETFLGVLLAGGIPVPIYPPARRSALEDHLRRQAGILNNAGAAVLVTVPEAMMAARLIRSLVPSLRQARTPESLHRPQAPSHPLPTVSARDCALIQYTSGSTGDPKGVVLTHAQILGNIASMGQGAAATSADVFVSWLPLYHDMGLIGAWLAPMVLGFPLVVMSPLSFLSRPSSWLEAISVQGGTISAGANFAYQACVDRIPEAELSGIDLSRWRLAFNGSEPVVPSTLEQFAERFGPHGFRREAMCPAYGLAEMGLGAVFTPLGRGPAIDVVDRVALQEDGLALPASPDDDRSLAVVSCGLPLPGYQIRIAGPDDGELPDRHEGRVECRGPSATRGYFANGAANRELWRGDWLQTGDLGYLVHDELYLTGRAKDLIIRGGRNLHPEDLEQAVGRLDGARPGGAAVFASAGGRFAAEGLVVVAETRLGREAPRSELEADIRRTAVKVLGAAPEQIVLTPPGTILRTPGGKIRRSDTRDAWLSGRLGHRPPPLFVQLLRLAWSGRWRGRWGLRGGILSSGYVAYVWALVALIGIPTWLALLVPAPLRIRWALVRGAVRSLARMSGIKVQLDGALPPPGSPAVIVANHPSFIDGATLVLVSPDPVVFVASTDLRDHRIFGAVLRRLGCAFVERGSGTSSKAALRTMSGHLNRSGRLVVFPEGSISAGHELRPFHLGAFATAVSAACPVVPVGIRGTDEVLSAGSYAPHRHEVSISVGSPLRASGEGFEAEIELRDAARRAVGGLTDTSTAV